MDLNFRTRTATLLTALVLVGVTGCKNDAPATSEASAASIAPVASAALDEPLQTWRPASNAEIDEALQLLANWQRNEAKKLRRNSARLDRIDLIDARMWEQEGEWGWFCAWARGVDPRAPKKARIVTILNAGPQMHVYVNSSPGYVREECKGQTFRPPSR